MMKILQFQCPEMHLVWLIWILFIFTMVEFWYSIPLDAPRWLTLMNSIFKLVEEIFLDSRSLEWLILISFIFTMVDGNFEPRMTNFDIIHFHHGWRKLWNFVPLDAPRMTNFCSIRLHRARRKFWKSMPLDTPRMTNWYHLSVCLTEGKISSQNSVRDWDFWNLFWICWIYGIYFGFLRFLGLVLDFRDF